MLIHVWERFGTCVEPKLCFDSGQEDCVWTKKLNLPGSILWHKGCGQPMMKSCSSYPPKEGDHIQSYGIYLWAVFFPCGAGESAKPLPRTCLITELQRQLKSTVWVCFLALFNLLMKKRPKRSVWLFISGCVYWGSALQLMHLMCLEIRFVLSLLKTLLWFCIKMTHMLLLRISWREKNKNWKKQPYITGCYTRGSGMTELKEAAFSMRNFSPFL